MAKKLTTKEITEGPLIRPIIQYTIPLILSSILQLLFNAADLVVVGQFGSEHSVGAVGATGSLTALMVNFFLGLSVGAGVVVAHGIGAQNDEKVRQTVHTAIPLAVICGAFLTVIGVLFSGKMLIWMGTPQENLPLSTLYMQIYFGGMIFNLLLNFGASILRAAGDSTGPMKYLTIAGVVNVLLNLLFVLVLRMDVAGVATATVISQGVSAFLILRALMKRTDACRLKLRELGIHRKPLKQILAIGLPSGIQSSLFSISNLLMQSSMFSFGPIALKGVSAASNLEGFVYVLMHSFNQTMVNFTGQNAGARKYRRIAKLYFTCLWMMLASSLVLCGLLFLFGEQLLAIYIPGDAAAIEFGMQRMAWVGMIYFLCGMMEIATGGARGLGISLSTTLVSVFGVCGLRILWVYTVFQQSRTLPTLYSVYSISWVVTYVVVSFIFFGVLRHRRKRAEADGYVTI
ncbi:MAG: MATE family efflux transporter [Clostridia bacterium]|nr:MATE family efflux transporter [Clostridia bacterium]